MTGSLTTYPRLPDGNLDMMAIGRDWVARLLTEWPDASLAAVNRQFVCELEEVGELADAWVIVRGDPDADEALPMSRTEAQEAIRAELADNYITAYVAAAWLDLEVPPQDRFLVGPDRGALAEARQLVMLTREHGAFAGAYRRHTGQARRKGNPEDVQIAIERLVRRCLTVAHVLGVDLDAATVAKLNVGYSRPLRDPQ